jgi:anthranilate phosphoribosyltransferase
MNILGPLANPAGARRQMVGVADSSLLQLIVEALRELGHVRALVVHGEPGMDELSPLGPSRVAELDRGEISEWIVTPRELGLEARDSSDLAGGSAEENARKILDVLSNEGEGAARAATVLNAAGALYVAGKASTLSGAVGMAHESVECGAALDVLERLRHATAAD